MVEDSSGKILIWLIYLSVEIGNPFPPELIPLFGYVSVFEIYEILRKFGIDNVSRS